MPDLPLTARRASTGPALAVAGDFDQSNADRLRTAVESIALRPGDLLTLDLSALAFCDSTGITALIAARNHTHAAALALTVSSTSRNTTASCRVTSVRLIRRGWCADRSLRVGRRRRSRC